MAWGLRQPAAAAELGSLRAWLLPSSCRGELRRAPMMTLRSRRAAAARARKAGAGVRPRKGGAVMLEAAAPAMLDPGQHLLPAPRALALAQVLEAAMVRPAQGRSPACLVARRAAALAVVATTRVLAKQAPEAVPVERASAGRLPMKTTMPTVGRSQQVTATTVTRS